MTHIEGKLIFSKLLSAMEEHRACARAFDAIRSAETWDELCSHPQAQAWAAWISKRHPPLSAAREEYDRAIAAAWAEYERAIAVSQAEYERARAVVWAEHERATSPARAEYDRATAPARSALIAAVRKEFE